MTAEVKKRRFAEGTQVTAPTDLNAGGGGGAGEKSYILNTSESTNWVESLDGAVDVSTTTTVGELPREFTTESGIKIEGTAASTGEYVYYRFSLDDVDMARKLKIAFAQKEVSGYTAGDLVVKMFYNAQADYLGAYTEVTVPNNGIAAGEGDAIYTFDTDAVGIYYELRIESTVAVTPGVVISDVILGPGKVVPGSVVTEWETFTPTGAWNTNITYTGSKRRVGASMEIMVHGDLTGAPNSAQFSIDIPDGLTIDPNHMLGNDQANFGQTFLNDSDVTGNRTMGYSLQTSGDDTSLRVVAIGAGNVNETAPFTWASGDFVSLRALVPITEWAGSDVNFINDEVAAQNTRFRATDNGGDAIAANQTLDFDTTVYNDGGGSYSLGVYTVPADGKYEVTAQTRPDATTGTPISLVIEKNAASFAASVVDTTSNNVSGLVSGVVDCVAGDTIEVRIGSTTFTRQATSVSHFLEIERIPDFSAGQAVAFGQASEGNYGLVSYREESVDISSSGDFSAAQPLIRLARINNVVNLTFETLDHSSSAAPASASGVIPVEFRPTAGLFNVYIMSAGAEICRIDIKTDGQIRFNYVDFTGSSSSRTNTLDGGTVSWVI